MHVIAFRYSVGDEHIARFERAYGGEGDWARFFATAEGYLGTELLRSQGGEYLLLDRRDSASSFEAFIARRGAEYERRSHEARALYEREQRLGAVELVGPARWGRRRPRAGGG